MASSRLALAVVLAIVGCSRPPPPPGEPVVVPSSPPPEPEKLSALGERYEEGIGVGMDEVHARELYQRGCDGGEARACAMLGTLLAWGSSGVRDPERGFELVSRACDDGAPYGCARKGWMLMLGMGVQKSAKRRARGEQLLAATCEEGSVEACFLLGALLDGGPNVIERDAPRAHELFVRSCDVGLRHACERLGGHHESGVVVSRDLTKATKLYDKACEAGSAVGCARAGIMRYRRLGVAQDIPRARDLLVEGCKRNQRLACDYLALLEHEHPSRAGAFAALSAHHVARCEVSKRSFSCAYGKVPDRVVKEMRDGPKEREVTRKVCDSGVGSACHTLGIRHLRTSLHRVRDARAAVKELKRGCDASWGKSCEELGRLMEGGHGVARDVAAARALYDEACRLGQCNVVMARTMEVGGRAEISMTLVTSDHNNLTCTMVGEVEGLRCEYGMWRAPSESSEHAVTPDTRLGPTVLQPVTTTDRRQLLVAGLWQTPTLKQRIDDEDWDRPSPRFMARCTVDIVGQADEAMAQWRRGQGWHRANGWMVAKAVSCEPTDPPR